MKNKVIIIYKTNKDKTDITGRDLSKKEFNFIWFCLSYDYEKNEYVLTGYEDRKTYGFGTSGIISNLRINANIVEKIIIE